MGISKFDIAIFITIMAVMFGMMTTLNIEMNEAHAERVERQKNWDAQELVANEISSNITQVNNAYVKAGKSCELVYINEPVTRASNEGVLVNVLRDNQQRGTVNLPKTLVTEAKTVKQNAFYTVCYKENTVESFALLQEQGNIK